MKTLQSILRPMCRAALVAALLAGGAAAAHAAAAADASPAAAPAAPQAAAPGTGAAGTASEPLVPPPTPPAAAAATGAAFDPRAATDAYLARLTPQQRQRSDSYFEGGYWLLLWDTLLSVAVCVLLLATGVSANLRDLAERWFASRGLQTFAYSVMYMVITFVLGFPLAWYAGFQREHQYAMSNQTFGAWAVEQAKGFALAAIFGSLLLTALYAVLRRAPRSWWILGAVVTMACVALFVLLGPVFIEPLFNKYTELSDPRVRNPILTLARANGVPSDHVYVVDASRQSTRVSANVAGLLGTTRIALNDNLLRRCSVPEIEAVMGHEMGHFVLHHVPKSLLFFGVIVALAFSFLRFGFDRALARWGTAWRVRGITDTAGLPLLALLMTLFFFVLTPVLNTYVRTEEAEADLFGLNAARQPDGEAEVALKLSEYRKLEPGPIEEWIFFDHPSGRNRIEMAMRWKAEHSAEPPVCHP
jgi:STE24 endopeptidase